MSYGNPQLCKNQCGAWIYFDKDSAAGHPSADKWLPLEYNHDSGIKTGLIHQCSKKISSSKLQQSSNLSTSTTQESQEQLSLEKVTIVEESIQIGITAQKKFEDLVIEVEGIGVDVNQTRIIVEDLQKKMDRLLNLVFARQQEQQPK